MANTAAPAYIARLNVDGTVDTSFVPAPIADNVKLKPSVQSIALQADGRIVIGGQFTDVGNGSRNGIARLNADGSLDLTFDPGAGTGPGATDRGLNRVVYSTAVQPDGRILVAGDFTNIVANTPQGREQAVRPYLGWIGERWFVLPNPAYGSWEPALFNNAWSRPEGERRADKLRALRY